MSQKGIKNAAALLGGTAAWEKAGYPMESSEPASNQNKNANSAAPGKESPKHDESKPHDH